MREGKWPIKLLNNINSHNKNVYPTTAGYHIAAPNERTDIKVETNSYKFTYIYSGKYDVGGEIISAGEGFLRIPETQVFKMIALPGYNCAFSQITITGYTAKKFLTTCNIPLINHTFHDDFCMTIARMIKDTVDSDMSKRNTDMVLTALMYNIMSYHMQQTSDHKLLFLPTDNFKKNDNPYIVAAVKYISEHYAEDISVKEIAEKVHVSPSYLSALFKTTFKRSLQSYIIAYRIYVARELLSTTRLSVSEIASMVGYPDSQYFSQIFKKRTNYTPSGYRKATT